MNYLKQLYGPLICSLIPLHLWHKLLEVELVIPHWHVVSDQDIEHVSGIYKFRNILQFKADLEFFLKYYTPISLNDIILHLGGSGKLPKRCFLPTFDDGFSEVYDVIGPILYEQGISSVFFLPSSFIDNRELGYPQKKSLLIRALGSVGSSAIKKEIELILNKAKINGPTLEARIKSIYSQQRAILDEVGTILNCDFQSYVSTVSPYLTSEQVGCLIKMGFDIGAHSVDHPLYSELQVEEQLAQTQDSLNWLSAKFQYNCQAFAFPYNDTGISAEFFQRAFYGNCLKVSFGIGGLLRGCFPKNLPRISMERTDLPANQVIARQFGRAVFHRLY